MKALWGSGVGCPWIWNVSTITDIYIWKFTLQAEIEEANTVSCESPTYCMQPLTFISKAGSGVTLDGWRDDHNMLKNVLYRVVGSFMWVVTEATVLV